MAKLGGRVAKCLSESKEEKEARQRKYRRNYEARNRTVRNANKRAPGYKAHFNEYRRAWRKSRVVRKEA